MANVWLRGSSCIGLCEIVHISPPDGAESVECREKYRFWTRARALLLTGEFCGFHV